MRERESLGYRKSERERDGKQPPPTTHKEGELGIISMMRLKFATLVFYPLVLKSYRKKTEKCKMKKNPDFWVKKVFRKNFVSGVLIRSPSARP